VGYVELQIVVLINFIFREKFGLTPFKFNLNGVKPNERVVSVVKCSWVKFK
jgi:hypothetical protein